MSGTVLPLHYLITLTALQTKYNSKKETQIYLPKVTQLINGGIRTQNHNCVTPKSSALSSLPGYLHNRPVTYSVSSSKSQLLSASFLIY